MKIAYLVDCFPTLSQTFVVQDVLESMRSGHDACVISLSRPENTLVGQWSAEMKPRIVYIDTPSKPHVRVLRALKTLAWDVLTSGSFKAFESIRIGRYGSAARRLLAVELFHKWRGIGEDFDILHCHFGPMGQCGAMLRAAGLTTARLAVTFHGYDLSAELQEDGGRGYKKMLRSADVLLPVSDVWKDALLTLGAPSDRVLVHHMGIACDKFEYVPRKVAEGEAVRLISVGRMVEKKGHLTLLRAIAEIADNLRRLRARLDIVGDGPLLCSLQQFVRDKNLSDVVRLHGALSHKAVVEMLKEAHVFVLASQTASNGDMEGIPVALMEAMALGLPVVSTWHSGIPELVQENCGLLATEGNSTELAKVILDMTTHSQRWSEFGINARRVVEKEFDRRILTSRLNCIYDCIYAGRTPSYCDGIP